MRGGKCIRGLHPKLNQLIEGNSTARANPLLQVLAFQQLHHDHRPTIVRLHFVDGADIRVVQARGSTSFRFKTLAGFRIEQQVLAQDLQRYTAPQAYIFGFVHNTHPSASQFGEHPVMRDRRSLA